MSRYLSTFALAAILLASTTARGQATDDTQVPVFVGRLAPCTLALCGGFLQNVATMSIRSGHVIVSPDGLIRVALRGLAMAGGSVLLPNRTLEVWEGVFTPGDFIGGPVNPIGTITTDAFGNWNGTVDAGGGMPFRFESGRSVSGIVLNDPGVRSEFVTVSRMP
jgi:hypothetical protein